MLCEKHEYIRVKQDAFLILRCLKVVQKEGWFHQNLYWAAKSAWLTELKENYIVDMGISDGARDLVWLKSRRVLVIFKNAVKQILQDFQVSKCFTSWSERPRKVLYMSTMCPRMLKISDHYCNKPKELCEHLADSRAISRTFNMDASSKQRSPSFGQHSRGISPAVVWRAVRYIDWSAI